MLRHGPQPPEHMENKIAVQVAEMDRLTRENQKLGATQVNLRKELLATQQEVQRIQAHIGSIQTESDIQIRLLLEKIRKMEVDIQAGESMKKDVQQAHKEAQSLITTRQGLATEIQQATQELQKAHEEVEQLPDLHSEVNKLRQEYHRLRAAFEYEKGLNVEKVEQLHGMEKNLVSMAREVSKLRADVLNAENRAHAPQPYGAPYTIPDSSYPPSVQGGGTYMDGYGRPQIQMDGGVAGSGDIPYESAATSSNGDGDIGAAVGSSSAL
ncbi:hypothetical protein IFM89_005943 [Coptis chinensis]|uniref:Protein FLX-like 4 n=1 Tax=Coptis chinensis TaxID=261450 RepID=A0A835IAF9_9MAGN|nr:hypothetical protein IFM89_005943 [Coptis chinensis]